ncbi:dead deah box rna [Plasmopara halstedii]|uniref:ATP-dependent RNA helicase n=1 Tax=Plasmopara halstedii TaxID=4781 RepID=A0A0P1AAS9_PLAHL|nr:dead deah box rna [Plasmopara halstedii]CEG37502.1 dead deah box rna [Plasmopara halstedii]|eukprot:XP_024573871.1 dead deah box rna [Plasmopara halstedii]
MSGLSVVPYPAPSLKPSKKRKKRLGLSASVTNESQSVGNGWANVDIENMQIEGFQDGCAFELEELTDYRVETTEDGGKVLVGGYKSQKAGLKKKRKKLKVKSQQSETKAAADINGEELPPEKTLKQHENQNSDIKEYSIDKLKTRRAKMKNDEVKVNTIVFKDVNLPKWNKYKLHPSLLQSLQRIGFSTPTRIQERTLLPALIDNRDVVGAAPTGSGKTLAFGLPILSQLLQEREQPGYTKDCKALILTPTRELAIQIQQHLEQMVHNQAIGVVTLVGGMAIQKQKRVLSYRPEIVIGTPGRLWDIISTEHEHMKNLATSLRFLVVDEADRMLLPGSYPELEKIFGILRQSKKSSNSQLSNFSYNEKYSETKENENGDSEEDGDSGDIDMSNFAKGTKVVMLNDVLKMQSKQPGDGENSAEKNGGKCAKIKNKSVVAQRLVRQTFLFSATLTIPEGGRFQKNKAKKCHNTLTVLERVMKRVGLRGKPAIVDLSIAESELNIPDATSIDSRDAQRTLKKQQGNVPLSLPAGLELCQHEVSESTRDSFLYYFLSQYPGRTIIFLNAIHQVRKLSGLLTLLNLPVFALHAEMQQRQRLKKLDGFRSHTKGILVATDVAARGLDIPSVEYVVHYHIARSTEVFVHRSGRTARANMDGLSISLVSPTDAKSHSQICKMLQRPTGLSEFPFDHRYMEAIDVRMRLAKSINEQEDAAGKLKSEATWFEQMAAAADLDMDEDLLFELKAKQRNQDDKKKKSANQSVQSLRAQLNRLLAVPLRPVGYARKFRQLHKEIGSKLTGDGEYRARDANEDLASKNKKVYKQFRRRNEGRDID